MANLKDIIYKAKRIDNNYPLYRKGLIELLAFWKHFHRLTLDEIVEFYGDEEMIARNISRWANGALKVNCFE